MKPYPGDDDSTVDELPSLFGGRDPLDQLEELLLLLAATAVLMAVVLVPVFWLWQVMIAW